jgi:hypothetical protein
MDNYLDKGLRRAGGLVVALWLVSCGGQAGSPAPLAQGPGGTQTGPARLTAPPAHQTAAADDDRDGVLDEVELALGTNPHDIDSDHDGLSDHWELWGVQGLAVGAVGSFASLPDANSNGIIAALDREDAGNVVLKHASAVLDQQRVPAVPAAPGVFDPADMDNDGIPNDFELAGFYVDYDSDIQPWLVKWDGKDLTKKYFKTDPTKWSTDGDPFNDFEESTKINLDQRVKIPGDHPCIPAYPDLHMILSKYTITLNQDVTIENSNGKSTESSWTNGVDTTWTEHVENNNDMGYGGYFEGKIGTDEEEAFGYQMKWNVSHSTETETASVVKTDHSGLTASDWETAQVTSGNSLQAAFLNLNFDMVNTGTLSASNIVAVANIKLGNFIIANTLIGNGENGELPGRSAQVINLQASTTGRATPDHPTGENLTLTMNQLRSLQTGAPLSVEVVSFKADTLVWQLDPGTGRRLFLSMGDWSPYQNAIQNTSARLVLDFNDDPTYDPQLFQGLPIKRMDDLRVACFPIDGTYHGSPPQINLLDAFVWAFETEPSDLGPVVTVRDGISGWKHTAPIVGWNFSFDTQTADEILANPEKYTNLFFLPIEPGNPHERVYTCKAPPTGDLVNPQIYWALCEPATRKIRAYSRDVRGISEMRFKPDPNADYDGELMGVGFDPSDPEMQFFYTYELPVGYKWTGNERVVAINLDSKRTELPVKIAGASLGTQLGSGIFGVTWPGPGDYVANLNFNSNLSVNPPADLEFREKRLGTALQLVVTPKMGLVHDALYVVDGTDALGNPLYVIDYNYLRKQDYGTAPFTENIPSTLTATPVPQAHAYGVLSSNGHVAVLQPQLKTSSTAAPYQWEVEKIIWRTYDGI